MSHVLSLVLSLAMPLFAERPIPGPINRTASAEASNHLIQVTERHFPDNQYDVRPLSRPRLQVSLYSDADTATTITVAQGELVRLRREADGVTFGFKAAIDPITQAVEVEFFRLKQEASDVQATNAFATSRLTLDGTRIRVPEFSAATGEAGAAAPYVEIAFNGIAVEGPRRQSCTDAGLTTQPLRPIESHLKPNQCCMSCGGGWSACGCAVSCSGNSCCVNPCC